jgi:hypothetical protein
VHQLSYIDIEPGCLVFRIYIRWLSCLLGVVRVFIAGTRG